MEEETRPNNDGAAVEPVCPHKILHRLEWNGRHMCSPPPHNRKVGERRENNEKKIIHIRLCCGHSEPPFAIMVPV